jgi:hypothetical protein
VQIGPRYVLLSLIATLGTPKTSKDAPLAAVPRPASRVSCAALSNAYNDVKRASDSYLGIPTQCFAANKAKLGTYPDTGREQYLANVGMKVNAKLQGTNVVISRNPYPWMNEPYMVLGELLALLESQEIWLVSALSRSFQSQKK